MDKMSSQNTKQSFYQQKINTQLNEINNLKMQLSGTEGKINRVDETISKLPERILAVRQMNYQIQTNFEGDQRSAAEQWAEIGPSLKIEASNRAATIRTELLSLERDINTHRISSSYDLSGLAGIDFKINTLRALVYDFSSRIDKEMTSLENILTPLEQGVATAEEVVKIISTASFQWKEGETPVIAVHAKDMTAKMDGILTLTNQRIIFEGEKEIILKKTFFIVTEKKIERTTILERPIGSISKIVKGRVGLLAGAGLYIEFKQSDIELKLDTKSEEADRVLKYHSLITSGQIDEELSKIKPLEQKKGEKRIFSCPKCGAPYTEEIYRGQLTVQCKYCNTIITVQ
jgi:hypothetical protein